MSISPTIHYSVVIVAAPLIQREAFEHELFNVHFNTNGYVMLYPGLCTTPSEFDLHLQRLLDDPEVLLRLQILKAIAAKWAY